MNTDLVVISGGGGEVTTQLQVLDTVVNKHFKDQLKQLKSEWLLIGDHALTPAGRIKKPCATSSTADHNSMTVHLTRSAC